MADIRHQIVLLIFLISFNKETISTKPEEVVTETQTEAEIYSKEELVESESKDGKLEIIKQIKKVNDDGSYTIGYEADDGSFKIESRDVLGHIKGTYGYIDDSGQIKRVSYSTSNSSEVLSKPAETVVQRIPKINRTTTTKRPAVVYSTTSPSSTTLRYSKARNSPTTTTTTTTAKPNYAEIVNMETEALRKSPKDLPIYATSTPRVLLQGRPLLRSTPATQTQKSEGQIIRPEIVTARPTELPLFRRLALKHLETAKSIAEEPEIKSNILRRQLAQERTNFDPQQHLFTLQQALGPDSTDVYSASVTTGTPRPLFTTTTRPRALLSTTTAPTVVTRPTIRYQTNYQRNVLQDVEANTPEFAQETSTTESSLDETTPTPIPVVQIPANRPVTPEPLVAIKHPFQRGTILVPLSQIQAGRVLVDDNQYYQPNQQQYLKETTQKPVEEPRPIYVRRLPPPQFRPIPVQVDENGYIRDFPQQTGPSTPYPLPIPVTPVPKFITNDVDNDIDQISPPVSTRDFQKLLQQLILRQTRLERINALTDPRQHPEYYQQPRLRPIYRSTPAPYFMQRIPDNQPNGPLHFVPEQRYINIVPRQQQIALQQQQQQAQRQEDYQDQASFAPSRRVARLLPADPNHQQQISPDEYLPPDVREMLLLRMLQLAINPALPVDDDSVQATTPVPQFKKAPVRNVEILGEESEEEEKRTVRNKRYGEPNFDYFNPK